MPRPKPTPTPTPSAAREALFRCVVRLVKKGATREEILSAFPLDNHDLDQFVGDALAYVRVFREYRKSRPRR